MTKFSRKYIYSILAEEEHTINIKISYILLHKIFLHSNITFLLQISTSISNFKRPFTGKGKNF